MTRKWLLLIPVAAALGGAAIWSNQHAAPALPEGFAASNGRLELARLDIATLYPGRVERMLVHEGDPVGLDDILAELSSTRSSSQLAAAEAAEKRAHEAVARAEAEITARQQQLRIARMELANTRQMQREGLVAPPELKRRQAAHEGAAAAVRAAEAARAEALAALAQAQAQRDAAASAHHDMQIRAPKAGRIEYRLAEPGNVLGAGQRVASLLDPTDASMALFLPTDTAGKVRIGDEARIVLDAIDAVWPATVSFVAAEAQFTPRFVETRSERARLMYRVKLAIPAEVARQHEGLLKGGLVGNGYVRLDARTPWPAQWAIRLPEAQTQP